MKRHICVNQSNIQELQVPSELVTKLYNIIRRTENGEDIWDGMKPLINENNEIITDEHGNVIYISNENVLIGSFVTGFTYEEYVNKIHQYFGATLRITAEGYYLLFKDSLIESILVNSSKCENHIGLTPEDIRKLTNLGEYVNNKYTPLFKETNITKFDELSKLTNLTKLNQDDFYGCTHLTSIDLSNIRETSRTVFRNCTSLTINVYMPNLQIQSGGEFMNTNIKSVVNLGDITKISSAKGTGYEWGMFADCTNLESVHLSELITELDNSTFLNCKALKTINIPTGLTTIKGWAFGGCTALTEPAVFYMPNVKNVDLFIFSNSSISIVYMNSLKTMPDGYWSGWSYHSGVFMTNRGAKTYKYVYFKDIEYIGKCAFARCTVNSLIINNVNPPDFGIYERKSNGTIYEERIFTNGNITNIYVPETAVETYKTHAKWSYYADNIKSIELMPKVATYEQFLQKLEEGDTTLYLIEEYM